MRFSALALCSALGISFLALPYVALGHEVYVLEDEVIAQALNATSPNPFGAYSGNERNFYVWGCISFIVLSTILFVSTFRLLEKRMHPTLARLKRFALPLARLTVGATLFLFGINGVIYGPELPLTELFGPYAGFLQIFLVIFGLAVLAGLYARAAVLGAIVIYILVLLANGWYAPLNYVNHLGAYLLLFIMGSGEWSLDTRLSLRPPFAKILPFLHSLHSFAFPLLRIAFGFSIMFAAVYAKFLHRELALQVVLRYDLDRFFPFEPLFIVLGAFIIEFLAGLMVFLGIAMRWTVLFLAFWLTLAHLYMQEEWWVHIILYGAALAMFCHGYDRWSLEGRLLRRDGREPVL